MTTLTFLTDNELLSLINQETGQPVDKDTMMIDVRSPSEYAREHIPQSCNIPLDRLSGSELLSETNKTLIFYCRSGLRTKQAEAQLSSVPGNKKSSLSGGIEQWKRCGFPTRVNSKAPLELMRQVQITVGLMILISLLCSFLFSTYFLIITAFAGLGLLTAGVTGFCGMAKCLMLLPYNKPKSCSSILSSQSIQSKK